MSNGFTDDEYTGNTVFAPSRRRIPFSFEDEDDDETAFSPTFGGVSSDDARSYSDQSKAPTLGVNPGTGSATPDMVRDVYGPKLASTSAKLESAYAAPHAGGFRQVLGALLGRRNPQLGGLISGETQREQRIAPLEHEYELLSSIINANRLAQKTAADIYSKQFVTPRGGGVYNIQQQQYAPNAAPEMKPQEAAVQDYMKRVNPDTKKPYTPAEALKQVNQDTQDTHNQARIPPQVPHTVTVGDRVKQWNPETSKYDIDVGPAAIKDTSGREEGRSDRSYQFHIGRVDKLRAPIEARAERISRLEDTLNQNTPQADALIAPELLTVMAGGQGSGLRMNEAEIARIIGGRTQWETLKAKVNAWQADPNKGFALTPAQRQQTRALFSVIKARVSNKMAVIDEESGNMSDSKDPQEHRRIYNRLQKRLSDIDSGTAVSEKSQTALPGGIKIIRDAQGRITGVE